MRATYYSTQRRRDAEKNKLFAFLSVSASLRLIPIDRDMLAGLYKGLKCEIVFEDGGQKVTEHSGNGTLRVDESKTEASR